MLTIPDPIIDGDFETPQEQFDSPMISTDEITGSMAISRRYMQLKSFYRPLPQGEIDPIFRDAYLVNEAIESHQGPVVVFSRYYQQMPKPRDEPVSIVFTVPGKSKFTVSNITGQVISWDPYGAAKPYTREVIATASISYELNPPPVAPPLTAIKFNGAPVDFVGDVYEFVGEIEVKRPNGVYLTEPRFKYLGGTMPLIIPGLWVAENNVQRWRGPIWERRIVTVNTLLATL